MKITRINQHRSKMSCIILIREFKHSDSPAIADTVRNAYLSNTMDSWISALTREITFQLIVMLAAILFIFMGVPLHYCLLSIPIVMAIILMSIYSTYLFKATELIHNKKPVKCWVAEACEPFFFLQNPRKVSYRIVYEDKLWMEELNIEKTRKRVIGTISVSNYEMMEGCAWLFRLAVDKKYRRKGIGRALIQTVQNWSRLHKYDRILLAISECQDTARQLFVNTGFQMKQMYHKQIIANIITLLMYQLECDLMIPDC